MTIFDLLQNDAIAAYWTTAMSNTTPALGQVLFPPKKKVGLTLEWLKGHKGLPVALMPSAFDAKPTVRSREQIETKKTKMPFFRESMRIGEEERQKILEYLNTPNNPYAQDVINRIYDDAAAIIDGANVQPERMIMSLITTGTITIATPSASGIDVRFTYNYDPDGSWNANNVEQLTGTSQWSDTVNSNPVQDIIDVRRTMQRLYGVDIRRAIMSTQTFSYLLANQKLKLDINPSYGLNVILTDEDLRAYLLRKTQVDIVIYDRQYKDEAGVAEQYFPDDVVSFLPADTLGNTWYGTTPEEADVMAGIPDTSVSVVNTGVAVASKKEYVPVNLITIVSQIVLPSFERMGDVYVLKVVE